MYSAAIIGAGPPGLRAAAKIQGNGFETVVLEEDKEIGRPSNCTGLISASGVKDANINVSPSLINEIKGAKMYAPSNEQIEIKRSSTVAYVIDRAKLDQTFASEAERAGVTIQTQCKVIDINNQTIFTEHKGRGGLVKAEVVIASDGVNSRTRGKMGIQTSPNDFVHTYQALVKGNFDKNFVELHFSNSFAKGFFAWVVPWDEETALIGLGLGLGSSNVKEAFNKLVTDKNISINKVVESDSFMIPVSKPIKGIVKENVMLLGDAAFQTKATTGGGIITGTLAGEIAGGIVADYYKHKVPLTEYEKRLAPLTKDLSIHWKIRKYLNTLSDDKLNSFFEKINNSELIPLLEEHGDMDRPSRFVGKILSKPKLWAFAPQAMSFLRG